MALTASHHAEKSMPELGCDYAVIGHMENWSQAYRLVSKMVGRPEESLDTSELRDLFAFVPPRILAELRATSQSGVSARGVYIESFIPPDELDLLHVQENVSRVCRAAAVAERAHAKVVSLAGFSSILLEGNGRFLQTSERAHPTSYTTGNTLTSALIIQGILKACDVVGKKLSSSTLLVIGSAGDIGSACVEYFAGRVSDLLLGGRDLSRLNKQLKRLSARGIRCRSSQRVQELIPEADIILAVASVPEPTFVLTDCKADVLVCDAGYPKNVILGPTGHSGHIFYGGMGLVRGGYEVSPADLLPIAYPYPDPRIAHGCVLEGAMLVFEKRYENYSTGRGNITLAKIEEALDIAARHGIELAPLFNRDGLWPT